MKTNTTINKTWSTAKRAIITVLALLPLITLAQESPFYPAEKLNAKANLDVSIRAVAGNVYINWKETDHSLATTYFIQRSTNAKDYYTIGVKQGHQLEHSIKLSYSFVDTPEAAIPFYYRVVRVSAETNELMANSEPVIIDAANNAEIKSIEANMFSNTAQAK